MPDLARADAGDTDKAGQETVSTWFAVLLDYLVHRVYTAAVRRRLETHDATTGVSAKDMEKALTGCLQFRADVAFERMAVDKVPIDMDKVHHLVGEELNGRGFSAGSQLTVLIQPNPLIQTAGERWFRFYAISSSRAS